MNKVYYIIEGGTHKTLAIAYEEGIAKIILASMTTECQIKESWR